MAVLAQFELTTPVLNATVERTPDADIQFVGSCTNASGEPCVRYRVESVEPGEFEAGLDADATVASYNLLTEESGRFFYQISLSDDGRAASIVPLAGEYGGMFVDGYWSGGEWKLRLRFPNNSLFRGFVDACRSQDRISLVLRKISQGVSYDGSGIGLTPPQGEALKTALEQGYYEIPRRTSLAQIADQLGISDNAVSERLRRGMEYVLERELSLNADERNTSLSKDR